LPVSLDCTFLCSLAFFLYIVQINVSPGNH
jgi:hypothetical protein